MEEQKRMFELDLAAEKQRAMVKENEANEKIRKLENLKALNLFKANHIENEKQKNEYQLKSEKQRNYDFEIANILDKIQSEKVEGQKLMDESKLAAEWQLKIIEKEANDKIRQLENDALRQRCDAIKKENEKNFVETQLQAEKQRHEDFEMIKELQKIEAETFKTKKKILKSKLAVKQNRIFELEVRISQEKKFQNKREIIEIKNKSELQDLKYLNETKQLNDEKLQIQTKLFETKLAVEQERTATAKKVAEINDQHNNELNNQQIQHDKINKVEAARTAEKHEAEKKLLNEQNNTVNPVPASGTTSRPKNFIDKGKDFLNNLFGKK